MTKQQKVAQILVRLYKIWPKPRTALIYTNPLELLVATILSAQATDKLVNLITPNLFNRFKTAGDYANAAVLEIDEYIKKVNHHKKKAAYIKGAAQIIESKYRGRVPETMEDLDALPGVARKTANVILGNAYGRTEGIVVDTHVMRLSRAFGLTDEKDPVKIEEDLMKIVPRKNWIDFSHLLINYGRKYFPARVRCEDCEILTDLCRSQGSDF